MSDLNLSLQQPSHQNHRLFSDHYLNEILPKQAGWSEFALPAAPVMSEIAGIFARFTPSENERQTEKNLIFPVLRALAHTFEVQAALKTSDGIKAPDYVFYHDESALDAHKNQVLNESVADEGAFAVGDAKYWQRPLDIAVRRRDADALSNKNPAYQIYFYMLHSGVEWGILSNGTLWRLYQRDTAYKLDIYYEVDLEDLVREGDIARFLYFYAFFHRNAFADGPLCLAEILRASTEYARGVGETLKSQIYEALRHVAQGFFDYPGNALTVDADTLNAVYDNALIVLYRLIFILYAEARELLPVHENNRYRDSYSLQAIKQTVASDLRTGKLLLPTSALLWPHLTQLFGDINQGNSPLEVATFNGGLFDPLTHPFLARYSVGDAHLQQAIDKLTRIHGEFVDYRDLSVRHMGTIYEGLLEYKLVSIFSDVNIDSHCLEQGESPACFPNHLLLDSPTISPWTIDLVTDKGDRKSSGSYYTTDYIVKFIVEQTVGPALREAVAGKSSDDELLRAVLGVSVLDPAMGSGHFLVEATEYIARFLVDLGIVPEGKTAVDADIAYWKRRVVQSCIYGVDLNPLAVELAKLSLWLITVAKRRPLSFLDHHLRPGNSLVGARLADLQQQSLATANGARKIKAASKEAPAQATSKQVALLHTSEFVARMSVAVTRMLHIEESEAVSIAQVKAQADDYAYLRPHLMAIYGKLADVITAQHFGVDIPASYWDVFIDYILGRSLAVELPPALRALPELVASIAARERFFHWELEFPERYFDRFGRALGEEGGFAVVIGNPPYVRQEQLAPYKPYFQHDYPEVYHGVADLFVYFFAQGLQQARQGGRLSYISSNSWLRANYATPLRKHLREATTVELLVDLGDNRVFAEAPDVYPAIHLVRKGLPPATQTARAAVFTRGEGVHNFALQVADKLIPLTIHDQDDSGWQLGADAGRQLFRKIMAAGKPLGEVVHGRIYRGVLTGLNEAFIIDQATRDRLVNDHAGSRAIIKKIFRGEDLRPWYQEDEGRWLIAIPCGWTRQTFGEGLSEEDAWSSFSANHPALAAHLSSFIDAAKQRYDKGQFWWELRPCDYYDAFGPPKIIWPDIAKIPRFSWDTSGAYLGNTGYILTPDHPWILGYLASRCAWYLISQSAITLGERAGMNRYRLIDQYMRPMPIPSPSEIDRDDIGALALQITALARDRYTLHERVRHRLLTDQGTHNPLRKLNQKLIAWWALDFPALRAELQKVFKRDIAVRERDEWETWFSEQRTEHARLTGEIVRLENALNTRVYALFQLTEEEIGIIEESTKYRYGEV